MILLEYFRCAPGRTCAGSFVSRRERAADLHQSEAWVPILRLRIFPVRTDRFCGCLRYHGLLPPPLAVSDVHSEQRARCFMTRSRVSSADTKKPRPTGGAAGEVKVALHLESAPAVRLVQS